MLAENRAEDIDDPPPTLLNHRRQNGLATVERPSEHHLDLRNIIVFPIELKKGSSFYELPRVIYKDIHGPQGTGAFRDHPLDFIPVANIGLKSGRPATAGHNFIDNRICIIGIRVKMHRHGRSLACQSEGNRLSNTAVGARNQCHSALQCHGNSLKEFSEYNKRVETSLRCRQTGEGSPENLEIKIIAKWYYK